jgi:hypothetical protein
MNGSVVQYEDNATRGPLGEPLTYVHNLVRQELTIKLGHGSAWMEVVPHIDVLCGPKLQVGGIVETWFEHPVGAEPMLRWRGQWDIEPDTTDWHSTWTGSVRAGELKHTTSYRVRYTPKFFTSWDRFTPPTLMSPRIECFISWHGSRRVCEFDPDSQPHIPWPSRGNPSGI